MTIESDESATASVGLFDGFVKLTVSATASELIRLLLSPLIALPRV